MDRATAARRSLPAKEVGRGTPVVGFVSWSLDPRPTSFALAKTRRVGASERKSCTAARGHAERFVSAAGVSVTVHWTGVLMPASRNECATPSRRSKDADDPPPERGYHRSVVTRRSSARSSRVLVTWITFLALLLTVLVSPTSFARPTLGQVAQAPADLPRLRAQAGARSLRASDRDLAAKLAPTPQRSTEGEHAAEHEGVGEVDAAKRRRVGALNSPPALCYSGFRQALRDGGRRSCAAKPPLLPRP